MNTFFKKSLMSTAFVFLSLGAMAADPIIYTWSGPIEPLEPLKNFCIKKSDVYGDGLDFDKGKLTFKPSNIANKVNIKTSSELAFTVVTRNPETQYCDGEQIPFEYTLTKMNVEIYGKNGLIEKPVSSEELKLWKLKYAQIKEGTDNKIPKGNLNMNASKKMKKGGDVSLWLEGKKLDVQEGDAVQVQALILVKTYDAS